jgi:hypothetical protein
MNLRLRPFWPLRPEEAAVMVPWEIIPVSLIAGYLGGIGIRTLFDFRLIRYGIRQPRS